ncbi:hypothetical protein [Pandoraea pnomenusa]|uniref:hypothetical protein n=1 Tax=Pandoraea pnomenusa TaxID=93220 RepID=UPI001782D2DD|nr:hypothetical protein [Pandoraea pnomenusa]
MRTWISKADQLIDLRAKRDTFTRCGHLITLENLDTEMIESKHTDMRSFHAETVAEQEASGIPFRTPESSSIQHEILARYGITGAKADALLAELAASYR